MKMLSSLDEYLHAKKKKKLRYQLTLSQNIDNRKILQSDWMRHNWAHLTKTNSLKSCLILMVISMQKIKVYIDSF